MFTTLISAAVIALASTATASPINKARQAPAPISVASAPGPITNLNPVSFDNWGGFDCLSNFDSFYGSDNFFGFSNEQTVVSESVVCEQVDITVIQQQLAILQQYAQQLITTQICQVEVQTIVWSQFVAGFDSFSEDIRHVSDRHVGFDSAISSHIGSLVDVSGSINTNNFGFLGSDIGSNFVSVGGFNWVAGVSESSVSQAFTASQVAILQSSQSVSTSSSSSVSELGSSAFGNFGNDISVGSSF